MKKSSIEKKRDDRPRVIPLSNEISLAGSFSSERDLRRLAERGYRSLIDLRGADELHTGLDPVEEASRAEACGLVYRQIPVSLSALDRRTIVEVRLALWAADPPLVLHCRSGRRASLCALIHLGCQKGWTVERTLARGRECGIDLDEVPRLRELLESYLRRHSIAYRASSAAPPREAAGSYHI